MAAPELILPPASPEGTIEEEVLGFMDLGTNSIRLLVVRMNPNRSYSVLLQQRQMVRLGEGAQVTGLLQRGPIQRTIAAARALGDTARACGAGEVVAVATAGTRNAENGEDFLQLFREETGLDMRIISGREEARLIYLGVAEGLGVGSTSCLFMDIGGGSTELAVGDEEEYRLLDSLHMGAIRVASLYCPFGEEGPVPEPRLGLIRNYVRNSMVRSIQNIRELHPVLGVGSSGTILNVAGVAYKRREQAGGLPLSETEFSLEELRETVFFLASLSLEERRKVPGLNPDRGDIIVPGGMVLLTVMEEAGISRLRVSHRGLREGLLVDHLRKIGLFKGMAPREKSVFQLGRSCRFQESHARQVAFLATELFDLGAEAGLHDYGAWERELLYYAALLHDVGMFIAFSSHQSHSHYIIRHAELLGFDQTEIALMAALAYYHRKKLPRKKHPIFGALDERSQRIVYHISPFLRMAESLDRAHAGVVRGLRMDAEKKSLRLVLQAEKDCPLEIWGMEEHQRGFYKVFKKELLLDVEVV